MSNRQYMKKKPQNKAYGPSSSNGSFLSPDDSEIMDNNSMGPMYEQIKSEVVSSVLNWLSMYMAADQEDRKVNEQTIEPGHCCECTINKRSDKSARSSINSSFLNSVDLKHIPVNDLFPKFKDVATSTEEYEGNFPPVKKCDTPEDLNMLPTDFKAGQVWPDWCQYLEKAVGKHSNGDLANSQVYYDKFNDRLCVYRRGLVEYPQLRKNSSSPRIENTTMNFKQNLKAIPEVRESLMKREGNLLIDKMFSPMTSLNNTDEYFTNSDYKNFWKFQCMNFNDNYSGLNINYLSDYSTYGNYTHNLVKSISMPNVQILD